VWIFVHVYQTRQKVENDKSFEEIQEMENWNKNLTLARQLGSLVFVYFACYTPFLAGAMYEWITHRYAPPFVDFTGVLVHIASVANPIMYLWTSNQAKAELVRLWNERVITELMISTDATLTNIPKESPKGTSK